MFEALGAGKGVQWVASLHHDTMHSHMHVVANVVDSETGKAFSRWNDYDTLERVMGEIAHDRGWTMAKSAGSYGESFQRRASRGAEALHIWGGQISFQQWASFTPAAEIQREIDGEKARWEDIHRILARYNIGYRLSPTGGVVYDLGAPDERAGAAGQIAKFLSLPNLERPEILGPFKEPMETYAPTTSYREAVLENSERYPEMASSVYARYLAESEDLKGQRSTRRRLWGERKAAEASDKERVRAKWSEERDFIRETTPDQEVAVTLIRATQVRETEQLEELKVKHKAARAELRTNLERLPRQYGWRSWLTRHAREGDRECLEVLEQIRTRQLGEKRLIHDGLERVIAERDLDDIARKDDRVLRVAPEVGRDIRGIDPDEDWAGIEHTYTDEEREASVEYEIEYDADLAAKKERKRKLALAVREAQRLADDAVAKQAYESRLRQQEALAQEMIVLIRSNNQSGGLLSLVDKEWQKEFFGDWNPSLARVVSSFAERLGPVSRIDDSAPPQSGTLVACEAIAEGGFAAFIVREDGTIAMALLEEQPGLELVGQRVQLRADAMERDIAKPALDQR